MVIVLLMLLVWLAVVGVVVVVGLDGGFSIILIFVRRKSILIDL